MPNVPSSSPNDRLVRLALCEARSDDVESVVSCLRNANVACRVAPCKTLAELKALVIERSVEVVVWGEGWPGFSFEDAVEVCEPRSVALVVAVDNVDADRYERYRAHGAQDLYLRGNVALTRCVLLEQYERIRRERQAQQALAAQENTDRRCDALLEAVGDPVAYLNEGLHIKANRPYLDLVGFASFEDLEGMSLLDLVSREDAPVLKERIKRIGREQGPAEELTLTLAGPSPQALAVHLAPAHCEGEPCLQVTVKRALRDVGPSSPPVPDVVATSLLEPPQPVGVAAPQAPDDLRAWLSKDAPSGLFSRAYALDHLARHPYGSIWLLQLDREEQALAAVGAGLVDALAAALGRTVQTAAGQEAVVARWGPSSLAVWIPWQEDQALAWAQSLRQRLGRELLDVLDKSMPITVSLAGVSVAESGELDIAVAHLEQQLQEALAEGEGLRYWDPKAVEKNRRAQEQARAQAIRDAVSDHRLVLFFQPIASLSEASECYEVLVRLRTNDHRMESPADFMASAEEYGVAADIDAWVFQRALEHIAHRRDQGKITSVAVKVSAASLRTTDFAQRVGGWLDQHGLQAAQLWVELPLAVAVAQAKQARELSERLRERRCQVVLSGMSADPTAMRMAEMLSPTWIKLAPDVSEDLGKSPDKQAAMQAILAQARKHGFKIIAAFVQDASSMSVLFGSGVHALQGNFLAPPSPDMHFDFTQMGF